MARLRNWLRSKLLDHELGVLGGEVDRAEAQLEQQQVVVMALRERFERLVNRISMRLARSQRQDGGGTLSEDDARILRDLRGRGASNDPFGPDDFNFH